MGRGYTGEDSVADDIMSWGDPSPDVECLHGGSDFVHRRPMCADPKPPRRIERCGLCGCTDQTSWCCAPTVTR